MGAIYGKPSAPPPSRFLERRRLCHFVLQAPAGRLCSARVVSARVWCCDTAVGHNACAPAVPHPCPHPAGLHTSADDSHPHARPAARARRNLLATALAAGDAQLRRRSCARVAGTCVRVVVLAAAESARALDSALSRPAEPGSCRVARTAGAVVVGRGRARTRWPSVFTCSAVRPCGATMQ